VLVAIAGTVLLLPLASQHPAVGQTAIRGPSLAQMGAGVVSDIRIEGVQRIEPETIRSYLLIQPGDVWDDELVDKSLKALFATGLFADVNLSRVGNTLVVKVVENPIINRIACPK
jgi:outer membrane protein insertion porin family